jgi:hypothetical protein
MNTIQLPRPIKLEINPQINQFAEVFANKQTNSQKRKQVYLNTVAILAVHSYLKWMEFKTDPANSDSWDYLAQTFNDVADLTIKNVGTIECRPITPDQEQVEIPSIYQDNRLACVVVSIARDEIHQVEKVELVGAYLPQDQTVLPEVINLSELQSCEELVDYIEDVELKNEELNHLAVEQEEPEEAFQNAFAQAVDENFKQRIEQKFQKAFADIVADYKAIYHQLGDLTSRIREAYNYNIEQMGMTPEFGMAVRGNEQNNEVDEELYDIAEELMAELEDYLEEE